MTRATGFSLKVKLAVCGAALLTGSAPMLLSAQGTISAVRRSHISATTNSCGQIRSMPTALVATPEGIAVVKMQSALSSAMAAMAARNEQEQSLVEARRLAFVRDRVDSLGRMIVRAEGSRVGQGTIQIRLDSGARRQFESEIRTLGPMVATVTERVRVSPRSAPTAGWIGVSASANFIPSAPNGFPMLGYCEYPVIESVELGSPAERAGVLSGDTIIAYNGKDLLENDLDYVHTFVVGQPLRMRVHRSGKPREMSMVPTRRPEGIPTVVLRQTCTGDAPCELFGSALPRPDSMFTFMMHVRGTDTMVTSTVRGAAMAPATSGGMIRSIPPSGGGVSGRAVPAQGTLSPSRSGSFTFNSSGPIEGATLLIIDDDMAQTMGIDSAGIVIARVLPNSPAFVAGLKGGESIREVNGVAVRDLTALIRAISQNDRVRFLVTSKNAPSRTVVWR